MSQLGQIEPLVPVQEITEPLAIKDSGNIQRFNEAAERNLGDLRGLSLGINTDFVPKLNALVALLNQQLPYINIVSAADAAIRTNANNIGSINALATHIAALLAVNLRLTEVQAVADNMAGVLAAQEYAEEAHRWAVVAETVGNVGIATAEKAGLVKPGAGLTVDALGTLTVNQSEISTTVPIENAIPRAEADGKINAGWLPESVLTASIGTQWVGTSAPYTYSLSVPEVTTTSIVEIGLAQTASAEQVEAYQDLILTDGGQSSGSITLKAWGDVNTIAIPITVIVRG